LTLLDKKFFSKAVMTNVMIVTKKRRRSRTLMRRAVMKELSMKTQDINTALGHATTVRISTPYPKHKCLQC
jgi:hypothetical protein